MIMLIGDSAEEQSCKITFMSDGSNLHTTITPGYCAKCRHQLNGFFRYEGSRYGQVGTIMCNHCNMEIHCTDNDNIQDSIYMIPEIYSEKWSYDGDDPLRSLVEIDFRDVFQINTRIFRKLEKALGDKVGDSNFLSKMEHKPIELQALIDQTCDALHITEISPEAIVVDERFHSLPEKVTVWLNLLNRLEILE